MVSRQQIDFLVQAVLVHLAARPELVQSLSAETGLAPGDLRRMAADPGFAEAVLDFIMASDNRLLDFAADAGVGPEQVARAHAALQAGAVN